MIKQAKIIEQIMKEQKTFPIFQGLEKETYLQKVTCSGAHQHAKTQCD